MTPIRVAYKNHTVHLFVLLFGFFIADLRERTKRDVEHKEKRRFFRGGGLKPGCRTVWKTDKGIRGEIEKKKVCCYVW